MKCAALSIFVVVFVVDGFVVTVFVATLSLFDLSFFCWPTR